MAYSRVVIVALSLLEYAKNIHIHTQLCTLLTITTYIMIKQINSVRFLLCVVCGVEGSYKRGAGTFAGACCYGT